MADYEKPMGFTAVNGRQPSPPRSHPVETPTTRDAGAGASGASNGSYQATETSNTPTQSDSRPAHAIRLPQPGQHSQPPPYQTGASDRDTAKTEATGAEHSPSRKRTYPEAFDSSNAQQYPPRSAPHPPPPPPSQHRESREYRSPDGYQEAPGATQPSYNNGPVQAGSPYSPDPGLDETDRRTMEALQANSGTSSPPGEHYDPREEEDDQELSPHGMAHMLSQAQTPTRSAAGVLTKDTAKRKRVFSNRTKTGCLTCRKRKKKCDEKHPECQNCLRGGFVCEGYTPRASWQKPSQGQPRAPALAQIQSKGPGMMPQRQHSIQYPDTPQDFVRPELRHDDHRRDLSLPGAPQLQHPREPIRQPYHPPDGRYPSQGMQPRYEAEAREHNLHNGQNHEHGQYSQPAATAFPSHQAAIHLGAPPAPMHHGAPATDVARAALEHVTATLPPASSLVNGSPITAMIPRRPGQPSERDKMLQGDYYLPYTPTLITDRNQCAAAVYRFNQACQNPSLGFAHIDRERLFREIVGLRPTPDQPCAGSPLPNGVGDEPGARADAVIPRGRVGPGCVIEAPFQCDYGYNLEIGSDVVIGPNCRIADTCLVQLGNGVVISPGVTLMCATYGVDPKERRKGKGRALGRGIVIEDEAWIGVNCTILPGVRVGKCSTVGAGSMIHKDVPPFTVVAGNPPKVVRGIGSEDDR